MVVPLKEVAADDLSEEALPALADRIVAAVQLLI
jgi:hypothetical protein